MIQLKGVVLPISQQRTSRYPCPLLAGRGISHWSLGTIIGGFGVAAAALGGPVLACQIFPPSLSTLTATSRYA